MHLEVSTLAEDDIFGVWDYYETQSPGMGDAFTNALDVSVTAILNFPEANRKIGATTRKLKVGKFPYAVLYRVKEDTISVLRVIHLMSDPAHWLPDTNEAD